MRFSYDLSDNYFKYYNEANGVVCLKRRLLKNPKKKVYTYFGYIFHELIPLFIIGLALLPILDFLDYSTLFQIIYFTIIFAFVVLAILVISFYIGYKSKFNSKKGTIEITKDGIKDLNSNGNALKFTYDSIELVVVTKNAIVLAISGPIVMILKKDNKNEIIEEIRKYSKVLIIDN